MQLFRYGKTTERAFEYGKSTETVFEYGKSTETVGNADRIMMSDGVKIVECVNLIVREYSVKVFKNF